MKQVAIIGLGLMGGSLGLALKRSAPVRVTAYARREETRRLAVKTGAVDEAFDSVKDSLRGSDLAVFCTPVLSIPALVAESQRHFEEGCVVTDVGSTKAELARQMEGILDTQSVAFVGSHPMAGSEKTGLEVARADLYQGAVTAVTPAAGSPAPAIAAVTELWSTVGARVIRLAPDEHDRLVARTSHLPHLVAAMLVGTTGRELTPRLKDFIGPGFRDTTRVAGGSSDMWHDIVKTNEVAILNELRAYDNALQDLIRRIEAREFDGVRSLLDSCRRLRGELLGSNGMG